MCIRDRAGADQTICEGTSANLSGAGAGAGGTYLWNPGAQACLLYTSDAADERSSVDLGGRRIIKKKK